ncbi:carbohydrate ABC transporter substrate-binding protein [Eubacterium sp. am_0171]|uniref:ABC transporter substrate-binding protein n=1 Tax=unclassified Eubacterium (in: firmicutes) TaxID=2624479 RepID=UPI0010216F0A|nr:MULTISPECIES: ABC transporter substrate-binding protein [unclassified Eubacterium (in: firmicutes)]MSC83704.1 extracellular solute-binding protein [Eubacterium sp. BIOML-A1]MSD06032.1 extracellular solute-binding protein [Eubacterium sp. BIOML-A2]RYT22289.1 carbohydrate ABC transporter substrate-binding protein [Eubacterium sp. am_0171]
MKKKLMKVAGMLLAVSLITAGCGSSAGSSSDEGKESSGNKKAESVTLTVEASQEIVNNIPYAFSEENIAAFEEQYPEIKVELVLNPDAQNTSIIQTKLASGQPSDLVCYNKVSAENELEVAKNCVDLSDEPFVENLADKEILTAPDGKIYGFAFAVKTGGMGVVYNKDLFEEKGVQIPKTYEEFLAVCENLKAQGITPFYGPFKDVWTFQMWTTSTWGYYAAKSEPDLWDRLNANEIGWDEVPAFRESLEKAYDLYKDGYMQSTVLSDDYNSIPAAMSSGDYAMTVGSNTTVRDLLNAYPDIQFDMFPYPVYEGEDEYLTISQLDAEFFIPKDAKHIEEAKKFLNFMAQPEQCDTAQKAASFVPNVKGAKEPEFDEFEGRLYEEYNKTGKTVLEMNAYMKVDLNDLWVYFQDMFAGAKTPEEVLSSWDATFEELMKSKGIENF